MEADSNGSMLQQPVEANDHTKGDPGAPVTLVEYGDYQSADCKEAHAYVARLQDHLGKDVRFTFRHFAVRDVHQYSVRAAEAAEAAGSQGRFWEMHDTLFAHQGALDNGHLVEYAATLGLDASRFLREVASHVHIPRISEQLRGAVSSGVDKTPAFFINNVRYADKWAGDGLLEAVKKAAGAR